MSAPHYKRTPPPEITGKGPAHEITRAAAVALVAKELLRDSRDDVETVYGDASSNIYYAQKTGKLVPVALRRFRLGDVVRWARQRWPGRIIGLPSSVRHTSEVVTSKANASNDVSDLGLPNAITPCHRLVREQNETIATLQEELLQARNEVNELRPVVARWEKTQKKRVRKPAS